jgi:hypothetical protein
LSDFLFSLPDLKLSSAALKLADWADISQVALVVIAAWALLGAILQVLQARSAVRETLTYNFTHRFSHPELLPYHQITDDLFSFEAAGKSADEMWSEFLDWKTEDQLAALLILNLFEELGGMYNEGRLHKRIAKEFFGLTARDFWDRGWWFISRYRESNPAYYRQWQLMLEGMGLLSPGEFERSPDSRGDPQ